MIERGKVYESIIREKQREKELQELKECSFRPKINKEGAGHLTQRKGDVHDALYDIGTKRSRERRKVEDKSTE